MSTAALPRVPAVPKSAPHEAQLPPTEFVCNCRALAIKPNSAVARLTALAPTSSENELATAANVSFASNFLGGLGFQAIASILARNPNLRSLNAANNGLTNDSVVFFANAVCDHQALRHLDFSGNPISLPSALALTTLAQRNRRLEVVDLSGTLVSEAAARRLQRILALNAKASNSSHGRAAGDKSKSTAAASGSVMAQSGGGGGGGATPYARVVSEFAAARAAKAERRDSARAAAEAEARAATSAAVAASALPPAPGPDPATGWTVVNIAVAAPPLAFESELAVIVRSVVPALNAEFARRRVYFTALANQAVQQQQQQAKGGDAARRPAPLYPCGIAADHVADVAKAAPFVVELIGDVVGLAEILTAVQGVAGREKSLVVSVAAAAAVPFEGDAAASQPQQQQQVAVAPLRPILHGVHAAAVAAAHQCLIVATRRGVRRLGVPPSLAPLLSDEPSVAHPDALAHTVEAAVAKAQGPHAAAAHRFAGFDADVTRRRWEQHEAFRRAAVGDSSSDDNNAADAVPLAIVDYGATFAATTAAGHVALGGLEAFRDALLARLSNLAHARFGPSTAVTTTATSEACAFAAPPCSGQMDAFLQSCAELSAASATKKNLLGKLDLYVVTPASRNAMLLLGRAPGTAATTTTLAAVVSRLAKRAAAAAATGGSSSSSSSSLVVASHFAQNPRLHDEASDPRSVLLGLLRQLAPDQRAPLAAEAEVDVARLVHFFTESLSRFCATLEPSKVLVLVIDGAADIDPPVLPCAQLRTSATGADVWGPAAAGTPSDPLGFLPVCLPRNLRIVLSAAHGSPAHRTLEARGRDSCDIVESPDPTAIDVDMALHAALKPFGLVLSDDELALVRTKDDHRGIDFIAFVVDAVRARTEAPGYQTQTAMLAAFPRTLSACCALLLRRIEDAFGESLARRALGALLVSRWGLTEMELRELLAPSPPSSSAAALPPAASQFPSARLNELLRLLRPVLLAAPGHGGNALTHLVVLRCRAFRDAVEARLGPGDAIARQHQQLAQLYRRVLDSLDSNKSALHNNNNNGNDIEATESSAAVAMIDHPLGRKALKELPYHAVCGRQWTLIDERVVTLRNVARCYHNGLGYHLLRELVRAFNTLAAAAAATTTSAPAPAATATSAANAEWHAALLQKLRQYIYFVRSHNTNLAQFPHLVMQLAVGAPSDSFVHCDAAAYFSSPAAATAGGGGGGGARTPHIVCATRSGSSSSGGGGGGARPKLHRECVNAVAFAPSGLRLATCSDDRSVRVCNAFAESLIQISQSASKVKLLAFSATSRYLVAATEDRAIFVFDASSGHLVSRTTGGQHTAAIRSLAISARGRYVATGSEDRTMRIWESETGAALATVSHTHPSLQSSATGGVGDVAPHPLAEDTFFSMCDRKVVGWRLTQLRNACDEIACLQGHATLPLSAMRLARDGNYVLACAREPSSVGVAAGAPRAEENIKVWAVASGRTVAVLTRGRDSSGGGVAGPWTVQLSPSERYLAAALVDGAVALYALEWCAWSTASDPATMALVPDAVTPMRVLPAFRRHATPTVAHLRFTFDSGLLLAVGNQRQLKLWRVQTNAGDGGGEALLPVAEYLLDQPITCVDCNPTPPPPPSSNDDEGAEFVVGDCVGRVHALRLKLPAPAAAAAAAASE